MFSVQGSLLFLYYVVFSVMSVQYGLCVSRIQCTQCSVSVASAQLYCVQCKQCSEPIVSVHSIHSQWCSVLAGLQSTAFMVCLLLFSSVQSSNQLSVGFRVYSVQYQFSVCSVRVCTVQQVILRQYSSESVAFSVSSVSVAFRVCTVQWVILRLHSSVSAVFRALAVHQECYVHVMFRVHTLNVLCPCGVLEF